MRTAIRRLRVTARYFYHARWVAYLRWLALRWGYRSGLIGELPFRYPFWEIMWRHGKGRPQYLWGVLCAAALARQLGYPRIAVIEFGVAGGVGLVHLDRFAEYVERISGVGIDVFGFDSGQGLPKPRDYRDLPQMWSEGDFGIDVPRLTARLRRAKLVLGDVKETVPEFLRSGHAPVGFISFDMDLYHSTMDAFALFAGVASAVLPRVTLYFDDIVAFSHGDFSGERLAIADFNGANEARKISRIYGLRHFLGIDQWWVEQMFMFHAFDHPRYTDFDGTNWMKELPLPRG